MSDSHDKTLGMDMNTIAIVDSLSIYHKDEFFETCKRYVMANTELLLSISKGLQGKNEASPIRAVINFAVDSVMTELVGSTLKKNPRWSKRIFN